jgi:hypothetical protein
VCRRSRWSGGLVGGEEGCQESEQFLGPVQRDDVAAIVEEVPGEVVGEWA